MVAMRAPTTLRATRAVLWSLVAVMVGVTGVKIFWERTQAEPGAVLEIRESAIAAKFSLVNGGGELVTESAYRGSWLLVFFGYTNCPDVCPTTLNDIALTMDMLGEVAEKVQPLFITIDPVRDTPEMMAEYVAFFGSRIVGLSGTPEQIRPLGRPFGLPDWPFWNCVCLGGFL